MPAGQAHPRHHSQKYWRDAAMNSETPKKPSHGRFCCLERFHSVHVVEGVLGLRRGIAWQENRNGIQIHDN